MGDSNCIASLLDIAPLSSKCLLDVGVQVEIWNLHIFKLVVKGVKDVELHEVERHKQWLHKLCLQLEQDRKLLLQHIVVIVVLLLCNLHLGLGLVQLFLILWSFLLLLFILVVRMFTTIQIQLLVFSLGCHLSDGENDLQHILCWLDYLRVNQLQIWF